MEIAIMLLAVLAYGYYMYKKTKQDQEARDKTFELTMRALEDKAKREGTFIISYFDKVEKK